jgi:transposase
MAGKRAQRQQEILERRREVARLRLSGIRDQREVAARLDVSLGTINGDFKAINEQWAQETTMDVDAEKQIDLARIDALISALWDKARDGDERAIAQVLNLMQHRAKLLGLNAPEKRELSGDENAPLTVLIQRVNREVSE